MKTILSFTLVVLLISCAEQKAKDVFVQETYYPVIRQLPLEPVYSRVTWSHLPKPIGPRVASNAPYLKKVILFEMPNSTLQESIVALAHSMGYEALYANSLAKRKISLLAEGTHEEILDKICEQSKTTAEIDHKERIIRVFDDNLSPTLP
ncbi:MAG: hypothetical protein IT292_12455 [Deltaproteobacteria bacterium]|nr:hypothetical protein [Deltaproteobacteria bacterium]